MPNRPPKKTKAERDLETALGGRRVPAARNDGRVERVFIRQLPLRFADAYVGMMLAGDEQGRIELCLGKSPHWQPQYKGRHEADIYTVEAQTTLLAAAELNFPTALAQIERRKNAIAGLEGMLKRLYALQASMMQEAMERLVRQLASSVLSSPPASPSSATTTTKSGTGGASTASPSPSSSTTPTAASTPSASSTPPASPPPPPSGSGTRNAPSTITAPASAAPPAPTPTAPTPP
jgi:hypothetical protein